MILGMGVPELMVILLVTVIIFGPKNLPKLGKSIGETVKNVREGMEGDPAEESSAAKPKAAQSVSVENPEDADKDE